MFSAVNEDYLGSGWSRGHMAPAGNNKFSTVGLSSPFFLICAYQLERVKDLEVICNVPFAVCSEVEHDVIIDAQSWIWSYEVYS